MPHSLIFKLKHDIANDSELALAEMELEAVQVQTKPLRNLVDILQLNKPIQDAILSDSQSRVQDLLLRLPYPGAIQGYYCQEFNTQLTYSDIERLTYFREVFVVFSGGPEAALEDLALPVSGFEENTVESLSTTGQRLSPTVSLHRLQDDEQVFLIRIIPPHCFLEASDHVVRLARKVPDVDRMYDGMLRHFHHNTAHAFTASVQMGYKWIEDFIDDRRPPNAYASHSLFGLRGRFFPRMARVLANFLSYRTGTREVVDPFSGVGTLGIEASLLGMSSRSYDVNPFFTEVSKAKQRALVLDAQGVEAIEELRTFSQELRQRLKEDISVFQQSLFEDSLVPVQIEIPAILSRGVKEDSVQLLGLLLARIDEIPDPAIANVARLAIAYYAKSMVKKYSKRKILSSFWAHLSKILYANRFMERLYDDHIIRRPATALYEAGDVKSLSHRESDVMSIVTSPPYTTAIDYVGNDAIGFYMYGFDRHADLDLRTIGSTKLGHIPSGEVGMWRDYVPSVAVESHNRLVDSSAKKAHYLEKYYFDMTHGMREISSALAPGGQMALIICDEQTFGGRRRIAYPVAESVIELGHNAGLTCERRVDIDLNKNNRGDIKRDCVLLFSK